MIKLSNTAVFVVSNLNNFPLLEMLIDLYSQNLILSTNTLCQIHNRLLGELFKTLEMNRSTFK